MAHVVGEPLSALPPVSNDSSVNLLLVPGALCILHEEVSVSLLWGICVQNRQVSYEYAFEHCDCGAEIAVEVFIQDAVFAERGDGCIGDLFRVLYETAVAFGSRELGEAAEDDALVVRPCILS
jgi:hypothetical protein